MHWLPKLKLQRKPGYYSANPDLLDSNIILDITKNLWGFVWLNDELALLSAAATLRCIFDSSWSSILLDQRWYMRAVFWHCRWMMTWGNGLEEHREIVSRKMSICAWRRFSTSPSAAVRGEPRINAPNVSLCDDFSYFFTTAKTGSLS